MGGMPDEAPRSGRPWLGKAILLGAIALTLALACTMLVVRVRFGHLSARAKLARELAAGATTLDFNQLVPFPWDELYVLGPGTPRAELERGKQVPSLVAWGVGMHRREDACLLLFVESGRYSSHVVFPRTAGDFATVARAAPYPRRSARFAVRPGTSGPILAPLP
jgi:HAMP domain-containing protein